LNLNPPSDRELKANANVFGRLLGQADPMPELNPVPNLNPIQPAPGSNIEPPAKIEGGKRTDPTRGFLKLPNDIVDGLLPMLDPVDQVLYLRLYRLSHGFGQSFCVVSLPTLANRCKCSLNTARRSLQSLKNTGLIRQSDTKNTGTKDGGTKYEVFTEFGLAHNRIPHATFAPGSDLAPGSKKRPGVKNEPIKELNTKRNLDTQTQAGVSAASRFSLEECRQYAGHLHKTGQGIKQPAAYATTIYRSGEADALIETFLTPQVALDISQCPDCRGTNFIYIDPSNPDRGVKPCKHESLRNKL
jgi:hypothetical protein